MSSLKNSNSVIVEDRDLKFHTLKHGILALTCTKKIPKLNFLLVLLLLLLLYRDTT